MSPHLCCFPGALRSCTLPPPLSARVPDPFSSLRTLQQQARLPCSLLEVPSGRWGPAEEQAGADKHVESAQALPARHPGERRARLSCSSAGTAVDAARWGSGRLAGRTAREGVGGAGAGLAPCGHGLAGGDAVAGAGACARPAAPWGWRGAPRVAPRGSASVWDTPSSLSHRDPRVCSHVNFQKDGDPRTAPANFPCTGHAVCGDE